MYWISCFDQLTLSGELKEPRPATVGASCVQSSLGQNDRSQERVPVTLMGTIVHGPSFARVSAVIRDISEAGARVRADCDPALIQTPVELVIGEQKFVADVRWRNEEEIGLSFLVELSALEESGIRQLKEILSRGLAG